MPTSPLPRLKLASIEFITIYGILCLPCKEASRMASVEFTDVQARPSEFLDLTSLTLDEFQQLVPPFEAAFQRIFPEDFGERRIIPEGYLPSCSLM